MPANLTRRNKFGVLLADRSAVGIDQAEPFVRSNHQRVVPRVPVEHCEPTIGPRENPAELQLLVLPVIHSKVPVGRTDGQHRSLGRPLNVADSAARRDRFDLPLIETGSLGRLQDHAIE
jgi:hypothetical protein